MDSNQLAFSNCTEDILIATSNEKTIKCSRTEALSKQERQDFLDLAQAVRATSKAKRSVSICQGETREYNQSERIDQLEQALEQSLTSLNELKQKLKDQHLLETQLAATEEIANLQQKAITQLKQQIAQQQQALGVQIPAAQTQIQILEPNTTVTDFNQDLVTSQVKIEALETQLEQQQYIQTRLQYAYLEMESERDHALARLTQFKQLTVVLQEQVLQQSQQAGEYEAALQYWKARYFRSLQLALQLKESLEQIRPDSAAESEFSETFQPPAELKVKKPLLELPSPPLQNQPLRVKLPTSTRRRPK